ncbi:MAG: hypothetical protein ABIY63_06675, partial [Fibrobacteria bacterium]
YPAAEIICITFSGDAYQKKYVDTLVSQVVRQGDAKIHRLHMPELGDTDLGCDYHPNVSGQLKYADALIPVIRQYLGTVDIRNPEPGSKRTVAIAGPIKKTSRIRYRREKPPGEWKDAGGRSLLLPSLEKVPAGIEGALDKP